MFELELRLLSIAQRREVSTFLPGNMSILQ